MSPRDEIPATEYPMRDAANQREFCRRIAQKAYDELHKVGVKVESVTMTVKNSGDGLIVACTIPSKTG